MIAPASTCEPVEATSRPSLQTPTGSAWRPVDKARLHPGGDHQQNPDLADIEEELAAQLQDHCEIGMGGTT